MNREGIPDLWTLVKDCEFFYICSAMMYAIVIGCSGAIAMSLTVLKKASSKTMQQVAVIFSYVNRVDFFFDSIHKQK